MENVLVEITFPNKPAESMYVEFTSKEELLDALISRRSLPRTSRYKPVGLDVVCSTGKMTIEDAITGDMILECKFPT